MRWFRDIPIKAKLMVLMVGTSTFVLLVVCVVFVIRDVTLMRANMVERYLATADLLASSATAALSFDDRKTATDALQTLRLESNVLCATLFKMDGTEFARFVNKNATYEKPAEPTRAICRFDSAGHLVVVAPIHLDKTQLGMIHLRASTAEMDQRVRGDIFLAAIILAGSILAAFVLGARLQRTISAPLDELVAAANKVTDDADYMVQVNLDRQDEFRLLGDTFNRMLAEIAERDSELVTKNKLLEQARDEMQQFFYTVSHDLKSPLVTCNGFIGMLKEDLEDERYEDVPESIMRIERAAQRMSELLDDLLHLSRLGVIRNEPEELDTLELVQSIVDGLSTRLEAADARVVIEGSLPRIVADRIRVGEVFENLLTNAIKYGCPEPGCTITVGGESNEFETRFFVRDEGQGIEPEYQEKIFGVFQRLQSDQEGTGIGLAAVARIVERHGGRAWVDSEPGHGATFWVTLPISSGSQLSTADAAV